MAVVQRGEVWQAQVRIGKDPSTGKWIRKSVTCDTKAEAEAAERALLGDAERRRSRFVEPTRQTLGDFLAAYLERERARWREATFEQYSEIVRLHITPVLGTVPLCDLSPRRVQVFLDGMGGRRITERTRSLLCSALKDAERLGMVEINAAARTRTPYHDKRKRGSFSLEEAKAIVAAVGDTQRGRMIALALYTGLRRGERLGLHCEDITWDPPALAVRRQVLRDHGRPRVQDAPKTDAGAREVPLVPQAVAVLRRQREELAHKIGAVPATGWVFRTKTGRPIAPQSFTNAFGAAAEKARKRDADGNATVSIPALPLHALRHTAASLLLSAGVPAEQAAKIMGHASLTVFYRTYADLLRPSAQEAAARLSRYLEEQERAEAAGRAGVSAVVSANAGREPVERSRRKAKK